MSAEGLCQHLEATSIPVPACLALTTWDLERYGSSSQLSEHCIPHSRNLWSAPVCSRYLEHTDWMRARWLLLWHRDDVGGPNNAEDAGDDGPVAGDAGEASGDAGSRERASGEE